MSTANLSRRTLRLRALALVLFVGAVVAMLVLQVVQTSKILDGAQRAREQRDEQVILSKRLIECTTRPDLRTPPVKVEDLPEDDCYVQQQAGAADFASPTGPFGQLIIVSAACGAANPGDDKATLACVLRGLKR